MTIRCKTILPVIIIAATVAGSCVKQSQNNSACTRTLEISFYSRSRCDIGTLYPGEVTGLVVCIFDQENTLAAFRSTGTANVDSTYIEKFDMPEGLYSAIAWTGIDESLFEISSLETGTTSKSDLLLRLKREMDTADITESMSVFMGESASFYVDTDGEGSVRATVNLLEITNRFTVTVSGLPDGGLGYEITVESDNGSMAVDGTIIEDDILIYRPSYADGGAGVLASGFTLLKLETGHTYDIVVTHISDGTEIYRGSLLGALILKNPEVDLLCDHDFVINFTAVDQCACNTYMISEIWVNNWLVHSYSTEF